MGDSLSVVSGSIASISPGNVTVMEGKPPESNSTLPPWSGWVCVVDSAENAKGQMLPGLASAMSLRTMSTQSPTAMVLPVNRKSTNWTSWMAISALPPSTRMSGGGAGGGGEGGGGLGGGLGGGTDGGTDGGGGDGGGGAGGGLGGGGVGKGGGLGGGVDGGAEGGGGDGGADGGGGDGGIGGGFDTTATLNDSLLSSPVRPSRT